MSKPKGFRIIGIKGTSCTSFVPLLEANVKERWMKAIVNKSSTRSHMTKWGLATPGPDVIPNSRTTT